MKIYLIGGAIRDRLLGKKPCDKDYVVVGSTIEEMLTLGYKQVGKHFPVFLHPETDDEYALARTEIKTGDKHTDFKFDFNPNITLFEDQQRRDFTMNSIAYNIQNEDCWESCLNDPFNGRNDIKNKIIRHISDEHFIEDPLRVLRAARQSAQLDFNVAPETMKLMKQMVNDGMLNHLTPERIWKETEKALSAGYNSRKYFEILKECGALKVILPEVDKLFSTPEILEYHPLGNSGLHTMACLDKCNEYYKKVKLPINYSILKFAILLHDIAKGETEPEILPHHYGHENRGLPIINEICDRLKIPNDYRDIALLCCQNHMKIYNVKKISKLYDLVNDLSSHFKNICLLELFLTLCRCDYFSEKTENEDSFNLLELKLKLIYHLMKDVKIENFSEEQQKKLFTYTGEEFGKHLKDYRILYLQNKLDELGIRL